MALATEKDLSNREFDLLVVGGGIVGSGVARDAAMRGLATAVIDKQDFASGTSSRSSRLLHGGIRYLAQGNIGLVREASREKMVIHKIAPHLSDPLAFIFPTHKRSTWSLWKLGIGVKVYDLLCGRRNLGKSTVLNRKQILELLPGLQTSNLSGAVRYFDGITNDARLTVDTLRSACNHGASVTNYVRFIDAHQENDIWRCELQNTTTNVSYEIHAKCVINATGPWSHNLPHSKTSLRLTKGVHLVIDRSRLPVPDAVVFAEGSRILFAIPWGERVILGTTDTDYDGPIDSPRCEPEDQQYVLDVVNEAFPAVGLSNQDVLSTWAGLRPLVADKHGNPSDISRRHEIKMSHPGWWDVTGGKLTSYRLMAEETVDAVAHFLRPSIEPCRTATTPLLETPNSIHVSGILPPEVSEAAVEHYCNQEWAVHLDDVMIRRTSWRYYHSDHMSIARIVADWMGNFLGWSDVAMNRELSHYEMLAESGKVPPPHFNNSLNGNPSILSREDTYSKS
ncbi:glycerol-3-phosphate dehydrogenase/oxidase [Bythopirellula polymerisocia]|uniref:Glycerol-3-phosphate dehydrogenase n=1 Tax=Bythopirellula polymerisocia TaxID=2528003 RepID=A0A5C6CMC1_9BACT|nr:glycerol-3-phosphate dehydrogenase/oxidase [Bythopirellula polymerisocia]TWU26073.1 Aerobic glycerol-3-phosphate dehydrogenase [Bythopirellula polymerisocia]